MYRSLCRLLNRKNILRTIGTTISVLIFVFNFSPSMSNIRGLPPAIFADDESVIESIVSNWGADSKMAISASDSGNETLRSRNISIKLFGLVELRTIPVYLDKRMPIQPSGNAIGISIYTRGVLIVGNSSFINSRGEKCSPSRDCGLRAGDCIYSVNGTAVTTADELQHCLDRSSSSVEIMVERNGKNITVKVTPEYAEDGTLKIGAWVRDSTVGIGTLSFVDMSSGMATALGHAVVDSDTGKIISVRDGKMVQAKILGVKKGRIGVPGELQGTFDNGSSYIGSIMGNSELGIYGEVDAEVLSQMNKDITYIAFPDEVEKGDAYILSSVDNNGVQKYSCKIIKTVKQSSAEQKGIVIEITDDRLLDSCGGIIQGMSGSPIIQDGKLVGVVTHVCVNL